MVSKCRKHKQMVGVQPGRAKDRHALRKVAALRFQPQSCHRGLQAFRRAWRSYLFAQPTPQFGLPRSILRQRGPHSIDISALDPTLDHGRSSRRVPGEEVGEMPRGRPAASASDCGRMGEAPVAAEVMPQHRCPSLAAATVNDPKQRPYGVVRPPWDRCRRRPRFPANARATSRRGEGKATPTHTPSLRPGAAPSRCARPWDSQRSTPRVGTLMISVANASGSGLLSRSPRAMTNRSARSAR